MIKCRRKMETAGARWTGGRGCGEGAGDSRGSVQHSGHGGVCQGSLRQQASLPQPGN